MLVPGEGYYDAQEGSKNFKFWGAPITHSKKGWSLVPGWQMNFGPGEEQGFRIQQLGHRRRGEGG